jgi:transketolase
MQAKAALERDAIGARVVSMPCPNLFDRQPQAYRDGVLPSSCRKRVAIEAGVTDYWRKYVGLDGAVIGIDRFGASAPAEALFKYFGFTVDEVVGAVKRLG